jgi:LPXTG-motif cell wall-anchored protein
MVIATLMLLAGVLLYPPLASTQNGIPTLSATPPVALRTSPTTPTTTSHPQLPKTGFETSLLALIGLGLLSAGTVLRRTRGAPASRRRR